MKKHFLIFFSIFFLTVINPVFSLDTTNFEIASKTEFNNKMFILVYNSEIGRFNAFMIKIYDPQMYQLEDIPYNFVTLELPEAILIFSEYDLNQNNYGF